MDIVKNVFLERVYTDRNESYPDGTRISVKK